MKRQGPDAGHDRPFAHQELLHHRAHRPRQVDAVRPHPRDDRHRRRARHAGPAARHHGHRARARHHHQKPGGPRDLQGRRRGRIPVQPHRHAGPRRLHLRGVPLARRVRGRGARRRRHAGRRGADGRERHDGDEREPGDHPAHQQDRPSLGRPRARARGNRGRARHPGRRCGARLGQNGRRRARPARIGRLQHPRAERRRRRALARAHLRQLLRPVPRRRGARAHRRRLHAQGPALEAHGVRQGNPRRGSGCAPPGRGALA